MARRSRANARNSIAPLATALTNGFDSRGAHETTHSRAWHACSTINAARASRPTVPSLDQAGRYAPASVLDVLHQPSRADLSAVDVAHRVGGDAYCQPVAGWQLALALPIVMAGLVIGNRVYPISAFDIAELGQARVPLPSTPSTRERKAWMPGTRPGMTGRSYAPSARYFSSVNGSGLRAGSRGSTPAKRDASKCHCRRGGRPQARLRV